VRLARLALLCALAGALALPNSAGAVPIRADRAFVPGEVIVRFDGDTSASERAKVRSGQRASVEERLLVEDTQVLDLPDGTGALEASRELESQPGVRYAEPNWLAQPQALPNDPLYPSLWAMERIGAPAAWDVSTGSPGTRIAVLDSGLARRHQDLGPNEWQNTGEVAANGLDDDGNGVIDDRFGYDFANGDSDPTDDDGHGSHVAGTIGARGNNGYGVAGVNWQAQLMTLKVCGFAGCPASAQAQGIAYAGRMGARVANMSLGGTGLSTAVRDALNAAPNTLFVVSAGNGGADGVGDDVDASPVYPCAFGQANVICVAASTRSDARAGFSNYGLSTVDLAAPGVEINSTRAETYPVSESFESPTSFASRWITGGIGNDWGLEAYPGAGFTGTQLSDSPAGLCADDPGACYTNNMNAFARHLPRSTEDKDNCLLVYDYAGGHATGDSVSVELSPDGASWTTLRTHTGSLSRRTEAIVLGPSWWGRPGVHLRFRVQTDGAGVGGGGLIDNVTLRCESYVNPFGQLAGTSMASPHVAGVAGLLFSQRPSASVADVRAALLETTDPVAGFAGATVTGGRLSAARALARFAAAPPLPVPPPVAMPLLLPLDAPSEPPEVVQDPPPPPPLGSLAPPTASGPLSLARAFRQILAGFSARDLSARPRLAFRYRSRVRGVVAAQLLGPRGRGGQRPLLGRGAGRFTRPATRAVALRLTRQGIAHFGAGRRRGLVVRVTFRPVRGKTRTATVRVRLR